MAVVLDKFCETQTGMSCAAHSWRAAYSYVSFMGALNISVTGLGGNNMNIALSISYRLGKKLDSEINNLVQAVLHSLPTKARPSFST